MAGLTERFCAEYHAYHDISADRRKMQARVLRQYAEHVGDLAVAGGPDLQSYLASRIAAGMSPSTVRKELNAIRPFVRWLWQQKVIDAERRLELEDVRPPRGGNTQRPKPYTRADLRLFWPELEAAYPDDGRFDHWWGRWARGSSHWKRVQPYAMRRQMEAIVALALYGALRRDEIFHLASEDMHHENAYVVVTSARKNPEAVAVERFVPWTCPEMRTAVKNWMDVRETLDTDHDSPWLSLWGEAHYRKAMHHRRFEMLLRKIGRGWEFHRMRHTCATELLRNGVPLETVQKILGHARIQQTLAYAELLPADVLRATARREAQFGAAMAETRTAA